MCYSPLRSVTSFNHSSFHERAEDESPLWESWEIVFEISCVDKNVIIGLEKVFGAWTMFTRPLQPHHMFVSKVPVGIDEGTLDDIPILSGLHFDKWL